MWANCRWSVGVATWASRYRAHAVEVRRTGKTASGTTIACSRAPGHSLRRRHACALGEAKLFDGSNYESGTPETSAVFSAITARALLGIWISRSTSYHFSD